MTSTLLAGEQISLLSAMKGLTRLEVGCTAVDDQAMAGLCTLQTLEWLSVDETRVTDAGLVNLDHLFRLEHLAIQNTEATEECLEVVGRLKNLRELYVGFYISEFGSRQLSRLNQLEMIFLGDSMNEDEKVALSSRLSGVKVY